MLRFRSDPGGRVRAAGDLDTLAVERAFDGGAVHAELAAPLGIAAKRLLALRAAGVVVWLARFWVRLAAHEAAVAEAVALEYADVSRIANGADEPSAIHVASIKLSIHGGVKPSVDGGVKPSVDGGVIPNIDGGASTPSQAGESKENRQERSAHSEISSKNSANGIFLELAH